MKIYNKYYLDIMNIPKRTLIIMIFAAVFGGFYSFIADLSNLIPISDQISPSIKIFIRLGTSITISLLLFSGILVSMYIKNIILKSLT